VSAQRRGRGSRRGLGRVIHAGRERVDPGPDTRRGRVALLMWGVNESTRAFARRRGRRGSRVSPLRPTGVARALVVIAAGHERRQCRAPRRDRLPDAHGVMTDQRVALVHPSWVHDMHAPMTALAARAPRSVEAACIPRARRPQPLRNDPPFIDAVPQLQPQRPPPRDATNLRGGSRARPRRQGHARRVTADRQVAARQPANLSQTPGYIHAAIRNSSLYFVK